MTSCLNNIVSIRDLCAESTPAKPSLSGYDIYDAPEVTFRGIAAITNAKYIRGKNLLENIRRRALMEVEGDMLKVIQGNGYAVNLQGGQFETGNFNMNITNPGAGVERGITLFQAQPSNIRKIHIHEVKVFPIDGKETATLKIYDNGNVTEYEIQLIGGKINTFWIDYSISGNMVRILLDNTNMRTYSSTLTCMVGCGGTMPNPCGYVKGYNGTQEIKSEGFGINATFSCDCDYSSLMCYFSKQFIGKIIWYKMRSLIQEERLNTDRLNDFTIFNRDEAKDKRVEFENIYRQEWNSFVQAMPSLLESLGDDCITCKKAQWVTNI